ncbi:unnamed protein product [Pleuronectes platessa]|uniref:Uncharacterized protein n=1 Tax=Pleuronectes platessa TaxID=8262 RepID=A0A9N7TLZ9_PLEPL|nr:unnamed protein product [Pleuronectes platessa]
MAHVQKLRETEEEEERGRLWMETQRVKRENRGEAKQDIFRSVRGAAPLSSSLPSGGKAPKEELSPSFYPPFSDLALLCPHWDVFSLRILLFSSVTLEQALMEATLCDV